MERESYEQMKTMLNRRQGQYMRNDARVASRLAIDFVR